MIPIELYEIEMKEIHIKSYDKHVWLFVHELRCFSETNAYVFR